MEETGAVKVLPCGMENVERLSVQRYPNFGNRPGALRIYFQSYSVTFYWPYNKQGQACPGFNHYDGVIKTDCIFLRDVNDDPIRSPKLSIYNLLDNKPRVISDNEVLLKDKKYGDVANLGHPLLKVTGDYAKFLGRQEFFDSYNDMFLDSFVRDAQGRLMHPGE